jgi:hypothetical protein
VSNATRSMPYEPYEKAATTSTHCGSSDSRCAPQRMHSLAPAHWAQGTTNRSAGRRSRSPGLEGSDGCRRWSLRVLSNRPHMTAGPASQIPRVDSRLTGKRQDRHFAVVVASRARNGQGRGPKATSGAIGELGREPIRIVPATCPDLYIFVQSEAIGLNATARKAREAARDQRAERAVRRFDS